MKISNLLFILTACIALFSAVCESKRFEKPDEQLAENMAKRKKEIKKAAAQIPSSSLVYATNETMDDFIENNHILVVVFYDDREEKTEDDLKIYLAEIQRARNESFPVFVNVNKEKALAKRYHIKYEPFVKIYVDGIPLNQMASEWPLTPINVEYQLNKIDFTKHYWNPSSTNKDKYFKSHFPANKDQFHLVCICDTHDEYWQLMKRFSEIPENSYDVHQLFPTSDVFNRIRITNETDYLALKENDFKGIVMVNNYKDTRTLVPYEIKTIRELYKYIRANKYNPVNDLVGARRNDMNHEKDPVMVLFIHPGNRSQMANFTGLLDQVVQQRNLAGGKLNTFVMQANDIYARQLGIQKKTESVYIIEHSYSTLYTNAYKMEGEITVENMVKFYDDWDNLRLEMPYRTQENAPESENGLKVLTRANFDDIIVNSGKDTLVLYYNKCTDECEILKTAYRKVQMRLEGNPNIQFAICDYSQNELSKYVRVGKRPHMIIHPASSPLKSVDWSFRPTSVNQDSIIEFLRAETSFSWIKAKPKIHDEI